MGIPGAATRLTKSLASHGATSVLAAESTDAAEFPVTPAVDVLELAVRETAAVLVSATTDGREVAGRLAARLDAGLLVDAVDLDSSRVVTQIVFGGSYTVRSQVTHGIPVIAVRPGTFEPEEHPGEATERELGLPPIDPAASARITARRAAPRGRPTRTAMSGDGAPAPRGAAAAHRGCRRHLYRSSAEQSCTVSGRVREQRLAPCRAAASPIPPCTTCRSGAVGGDAVSRIRTCQSRPSRRPTA